MKNLESDKKNIRLDRVTFGKEDEKFFEDVEKQIDIDN